MKTILIILLVTVSVCFATEQDDYYDIGYAYDAEDYADAIAKGEAFLIKYPAGKFRANALISIGRTYTKQNDFLTAAEKFEEAITCAGVDSKEGRSALFAKVSLYHLICADDEAVTAAERFVKTYSTVDEFYIRSLWSKGIALRRLDDTDAARTVLENAITLATLHREQDALEDIQNSLLRLELDVAFLPNIVPTDRAVKDTKDDWLADYPTEKWKLAHAMAEKGHAYFLASGHDPNYETANLNAAIKVLSAITTDSRINDVNLDTTREAYTFLGLAQYTAEEYASASSSFQYVINNYLAHPERGWQAQFNLGRCEEKLGNYTAAKVQYQAIIDSNSHAPIAEACRIRKAICTKNSLSVLSP